MMSVRFVVFCAALAAASPAFAAGAGYGSMFNGANCSDLRRTADERIAACRHMIVSHLLNSEGVAIMQLNLGVAYSDNNDSADALAAYTASIAERPMWLAYYNRAALLANQGRNDAALADLDAAAALTPGEAAIFFLRGQIHRSLGQQGPALADLETAARLKPDLPGAAAARCEARLAAGQPAGPAEGCNAAPNPADRITALNRRGIDAYRSGDNLTAIAAFTDVLALDPKAAIALYLRGRARQRFGDKDGGAVDVYRALVLDSGVDAKAAAFQP